MKPLILPSDYISYYSSETTKTNYRTALRRYLSIVTGKSCRNLDKAWVEYLASSSDPAYDLSRFPSICETLPKPLAPMTLIAYMTTGEQYLRDACGITLSVVQRRMRKKGEPLRNPITREQELSRKMIRDILAAADERLRLEILIAVSSGMRIGEMVGITLSNINLYSDPVEIYIPAHLTKNKTARTTYISEEATTALLTWLSVRERDIRRSRKRVPTQTIIDTDDRLIPFSAGNERDRLNETLDAIGYNDRDPITGRHLIHFHLFRKFFLTEAKLSGASKEIIEEMAGHRGYLSISYHRPSRKERLEAYKKALTRLRVLIPVEPKTIDLMDEIMILRESNEYMLTMLQKVELQLSRLLDH